MRVLDKFKAATSLLLSATVLWSINNTEVISNKEVSALAAEDNCTSNAGSRRAAKANRKLDREDNKLAKVKCDHRTPSFIQLKL